MKDTSLEELQQALKEARDELLRRKAEKELHLRQLNETETRLKESVEHRDLLDRVRLLFQLSSDYARQQAKQQLETLVTNALKYVFGSTFRFQIELSDHGGNPTAEFYVVSKWDEQEVKNRPQDARGGVSSTLSHWRSGLRSWKRSSPVSKGRLFWMNPENM